MTLQPQTEEEEEQEGGDVEIAGNDAFRAAKSARIGARIARLVRVLRIIRVIKLFVAARRGKKGAEIEEEKEPEDEGAPSELSKALQAQISKKTIIFVLVLLIGQVGIEFIPYAGVDVQFLSDIDKRALISMAELHAAITNNTDEGGLRALKTPVLSIRRAKCF